MQAPTAPTTAVENDDAIDIHALIGTLIEGRWWLIISTLLALALGGLYAFSATRIYQSDALIQVETKNSGASAALGDMAEAFGKESPTSGELEIIKSRMVIGQAVDRLGLALKVQPKYFPVVGQAIAKRYLPTQAQPLAAAPLGLRQYAWGGESLVVPRLDVPEDLIGVPLQLVVTGKNSYSLLDPQGNLLVSGVAGQAARAVLGGTATVELFVQSLSAAPKTQFTLVRQPREAVITQVLSGISATEKGSQSGIIQLTYKGSTPALVAETLNAIAITYQQQNVERKSAEAQATLAFLEQQLPELRKKLDASESALNDYRLKVGSVDLTQETQIVLQEAVQLEQLRLELEQKKREALQRFTASHPAVQTIDSQIARLNGRLGGISSRTKSLPETQQELLTLMQDVKVNTDLYANLLNNAQELQVVKAGTVGNVRIIDAAYPARGPIKPKVSAILILSAVCGLIIGGVIIFIRSALNQGVRDPAVVEKATGLPTYASVPFASGQAALLKQREAKKAGHAILAVAEPLSISVESLRSLRSALHFALSDAPNNIVMLTGPSPGLGKSFISLNLAATLAASGKRVVVVDADMRRGHIHTMMGAERAPGLSDVISGSLPLEKALSQTAAAGLYLLSTGTIPPNPSELLLKKEFADVLKQLSSSFDLVLVDTPPVLAVADATVVGSLAGTTLVVLKTGDHPLRMIEDTVRRLRSAGVAVRGTVFNQTEVSQNYYGSKYGYQYGQYIYEYKK